MVPVICAFIFAPKKHGDSGGGIIFDYKPTKSTFTIVISLKKKHS